MPCLRDRSHALERLRTKRTGQLHLYATIAITDRAVFCKVSRCWHATAQQRQQRRSSPHIAHAQGADGTPADLPDPRADGKCTLQENRYTLQQEPRALRDGRPARFLMRTGGSCTPQRSWRRSALGKGPPPQTADVACSAGASGRARPRPVFDS